MTSDVNQYTSSNQRVLNPIQVPNSEIVSEIIPIIRSNSDTDSNSMSKSILFLMKSENYLFGYGVQFNKLTKVTSPTGDPFDEYTQCDFCETLEKNKYEFAVYHRENYSVKQFIDNKSRDVDVQDIDHKKLCEECHTPIVDALENWIESNSAIIVSHMV